MDKSPSLFQPLAGSQDFFSLDLIHDPSSSPVTEREAIARAASPTLSIVTWTSIPITAMMPKTMLVIDIPTATAFNTMIMMLPAFSIFPTP
jgi:hypothetical protein